MLPVAAFAAGILTAHFFYFTLSDLSLPGALAAVALALAFFVPGGGRMRLAAVACALALVGIAVQVLHRPGRTPRLDAGDGEMVLLDGCVTNPPVFSPYREQFTLQLAPKASARISVTLKADEQLDLAYGQKVETAAKVRLPRNFQNPGAFDYAGYLAAQRIFWTASVASPADVRVLPGRCGSRAMAWLYGAWTWMLDRLTRLYPDDAETAGLLKATLLGETSGVDRRWTSDFRLTGTYHALVISGLHISILALTVLYILRLFFLGRVARLMLAAGVCWFYAFLAGGNAPAIRAAAGFTLFALASAVFRRTRTLNLLALIALIYLAVDPDQLFDASFQLSLLSVAIIAVFAIPAMERYSEPLRAAVKRFDQVRYDPQVEPRAAGWRVELRLLAQTVQLWTRLPESWVRGMVAGGARVAVFAADAVIVSACVQFGLALPLAGYFHRLSVTGLSANVVVVPLLTLVVPLGFAAILTMWHPLAWLTKVLLAGAEAAAHWHVHFEPSWRIAALPLGISIAFAAALVWLAVAIRHERKRSAMCALACSGVLFATICWQPFAPELRARWLELTAIDVNQGDSLLVVFPDGETMLVDAGGFPGMERMARKPQMDIGEDVVSPYLWSRRIHHLDYAVLTHGHSDHMGGLPAILDNFRPKVLWIGAEPATAAWQNVERHAAADGVRIVALNRASTPVEIGGARVRVLAPAVDYVSGDAPSNDDSLVLEIAYGRKTFLLTGDAERAIEDDMLASGELRPVTLLKVGHHGSRTSSSEEFLDEVKPRFALISDGYKNSFHHPNPDVLRRLSEQHTAILRTDQRGLVTFRTDGEKMEIETFR